MVFELCGIGMTSLLLNVLNEDGHQQEEGPAAQAGARLVRLQPLLGSVITLLLYDDP